MQGDVEQTDTLIRKCVHNFYYCIPSYAVFLIHPIDDIYDIIMGRLPVLQRIIADIH